MIVVSIFIRLHRSQRGFVRPAVFPEIQVFPFLFDFIEAKVYVNENFSVYNSKFPFLFDFIEAKARRFITLPRSLPTVSIFIRLHRSQRFALRLESTAAIYLCFHFYSTS